MKSAFRTAFVALVGVGLMTVGWTAPAYARHCTHYSHTTGRCISHANSDGSRSSHHMTKHKVSSQKMIVREAQSHLINLGYYKGKVDGVIGKKTRAAIRSFQRDNGLHVDGILGPKTMAALIAADKTKAMSSLPMPTQTATPQPGTASTDHTDFYGYYDQQYADPMMTARQNSNPAMQELPTRFAQVDLTEIPTGDTKFYNVVLNGQPILQINNQPSVIGVSRTFALGDEDGIIFSAYNAGDPVCAYTHFLLIMRAGSTALNPIGNCTRGYQASIKNESLFIVFPEADDARAVGATWRYDHGSLNRL